MRRTPHLDDEDPAMAALSLVQRLADDRPRDHIETRLRFRASSPRLNVSLVPTNLIGALWLQFAAAVDGLKNFNQCSQCGAPFEVSRDPRTGKRSDAWFCSSRCRVGHYRERIEQARRIRSTGITVERIACELDADVRDGSGLAYDCAKASTQSQASGNSFEEIVSPSAIEPWIG
jgi:hypothetical protein